MSKESDVAGKRVPGKYVVWGIGAFLAVFLAVLVVIAVSIAPAAERFKAGRANSTAPRP